MSGRAKWVRDGTLIAGDQTEIDIRTTRKRADGQHAWLTVKGNDRDAEAAVAILLAALNRRRRPARSGGRG